MSVSACWAKPIPPAEAPVGIGAIPPLQSGERLTRDEFERHDNAMPDLVTKEGGK